MTSLIILLITCFSILLLQIKTSKEISAPIYGYVLLILLYVMLPRFHLQFYSSVVTVDLLNLNPVISDWIITNVIFINTILFFILITRLGKRLLTPPAGVCVPIISYQLFYILFIPTILLVYFFPWADFASVRGIGHSFASYFKLGLLLSFVSACIRHRYDGSPSRRTIVVMLCLLILVSIIDTARTTLFIAMLGFAYSQKFTFQDLLRNIFLVLVFVTIFFAVTLIRSNIELSPKALLWPFFSEAIFGSYSLFNVASLNLNNVVTPENSLYLIPDLLFQVLPDNVRQLVGYSFSFENIIEEANSQKLLEGGKLSPLGGYFFLADWFYYFSWLGAFLSPIAIYCYLFFATRQNSFMSNYLFIFWFIALKSPIISVILLICAVFLFKCFNNVIVAILGGRKYAW